MDRKEYNKQYYQRNKEEIIGKAKKRNKENYDSDMNKEKCRKYRLKYPERMKEKDKRYKNKYPERVKATSYSNRNNQRDTKCIFNSKHTENLHFHHTDYKKNEGFTLCRDCHSKLHLNQIKTNHLSTSQKEKELNYHKKEGSR